MVGGSRSEETKVVLFYFYSDKVGVHQGINRILWKERSLFSRQFAEPTQAPQDFGKSLFHPGDHSRCCRDVRSSSSASPDVLALLQTRGVLTFGKSKIQE
eukprot:GHVS01055315.1.p1 GENE.GHVS01055315.1~~GHVS01055315.1.p1  ORF type:complete len:100 (+),score=6.43 GHVS01055315.1:1108-1407(+)